MKLVQAYTMEEQSTSRFYRDNQKNFMYQLKSIRFNETKKAIELFMQGAVFISLLFFGGRLVRQMNCLVQSCCLFLQGVYY